MSHVIAEISVDPIGTQTPAESDYIVAAERALKKAMAKNTNLRYQINAMSTTLEGPRHDVFSVLEKMHTAPFQEGAQRVITTVRIDERHDRSASIQDSIEIVEQKLAVSKSDMC